MSDKITFSIPDTRELLETMRANTAFHAKLNNTISEMIEKEHAFVESLIERVVTFGFKPALIQEPAGEQSEQNPCKLLDADGNVLAMWWKRWEADGESWKRVVGGKLTCWAGTWKPTVEA